LILRAFLFFLHQIIAKKVKTRVNWEVNSFRKSIRQKILRSDTWNMNLSQALNNISSVLQPWLQPTSEPDDQYIFVKEHSRKADVLPHSYKSLNNLKIDCFRHSMTGPITGVWMRTIVVCYPGTFL